MKRLILLVIFLLMTSPAYASSYHGLAALLFVLVSIPIAVIGFVCTLLCAEKKFFRRPQFFVIYIGFFVAIPFGLIVYLVKYRFATAFGGNIDAILVCEPILLVFVLLPAVVQYLRRHVKAQLPSDDCNKYDTL